MMTDRLRRAMGFVRTVLGLKQIVQGATLIVGGLLVMFAGPFTHYCFGRAHALVYGAYLICGGRL